MYTVQLLLRLVSASFLVTFIVIGPRAQLPAPKQADSLAMCLQPKKKKAAWSSSFFSLFSAFSRLAINCTRNETVPYQRSYRTTCRNLVLHSIFQSIS